MLFVPNTNTVRIRMPQRQTLYLMREAFFVDTINCFKKFVFNKFIKKTNLHYDQYSQKMLD